MAMKDKDPNEEEFDQEGQENLGDSDDSFGLPDLDFEPLDEIEDQETPAAEAGEEAGPENTAEAPAAEAGEEESPAGSPDTAEPVEEAAEPETVAEPDEDEATAEATAAAFDDQDDEGPAPEEEETEDREEEEEEEQATTPVRTYTPPRSQSQAPMIIGVILAVVVVALGIWYFVFYEPAAPVAEKQPAATEQTEAEKAELKRQQAEDARRQEEERKRKEEEARKKAEEEARAAATFSTISSPTGRYYIVIASFVDSDLAADYGNRLAAEEGVSTVLLGPQGEKKLHRLALGMEFGSYPEAQDEANRLKEKYGEDIWVMKY